MIPRPTQVLCTCLIVVTCGRISLAFGLLSFGGSDKIPTLGRGYTGWFDGQVAQQAASAVQRAVAAGKVNLEVTFPPVPNVDEAKLGTPLNQKFGKTIIAKDLQVKGGYVPGSDLSRQLIAFSNIYWAKKIAPSVRGGFLGGKPVTVLSAEPVSYDQIQSKGSIAKLGPLRVSPSKDKIAALIAVNPGGEEIWKRIRSTLAVSGPMVVLNNAYSTTYDLGNKQNYEEAYFLKRISKGYVFRSFPGPWMAYLEKPDGTVELLQTYKTKPKLQEVSTLVRDESFRRFAINNDRWTPGFGERL